jgi:hypothetical protein
MGSFARHVDIYLALPAINRHLLFGFELEILLAQFGSDFQQVLLNAIHSIFEGVTLLLMRSSSLLL